MKINTNQKCRVVLTKFGADTYNKFNSQFGKYAPKILNEDDVLEDSLWSLMQIFGSSIYLGMKEVPFKNNGIEITNTF